MDIMENNNIEALINLHKLDTKLFEIDNKRGDLPKKIEKTNQQIVLLNDNILDNESRKNIIEKRKNECIKNNTFRNTVCFTEVSDCNISI